MEEMMLIMAHITPKELLVEELEENLKFYRLAPTEENENKLLSACQALLAKRLTDKLGIREAIERISNGKDAQKFLQTNGN